LGLFIQPYMSNLSLYNFPEVYDSLRTPAPHVFEEVYQTMVKLLGHVPESVMDPASGPATWLSFFADKGIMVAGNDIVPEMIESAKKKCNGQSLEFIVGDMCDLKFQRGPFEVCFELSGHCGLFLPGHETFYKFMRELSRNTKPNGMIMVTLFFVEPCPDHYPFMVDQWGPVNVNGQGSAWISYEILRSNPTLNLDQVRRTVRTQGIPAFPNPLVEEYEMFSWTEDRFLAFLKNFPELVLIDSFSIEKYGVHHTSWGQQRGETTVVLRKLGCPKDPLLS